MSGPFIFPFFISLRLVFSLIFVCLCVVAIICVVVFAADDGGGDGGGVVGGRCCRLVVVKDPGKAKRAEMGV